MAQCPASQLSPIVLNTVLLSSSLAKKIFGDADPIDKIVKIDTKFDVKVTGVYGDLPDNAEFKEVSFIAPFDFYLSCYDWARKKYTDWGNICIYIYVQLYPGADFDHAGRRFPFDSNTCR